MIPYDDDRLKPKRTALWVTMGVVCAILACGLVAGSLVYILVPRTVVVEFIPPIRNNVTFTRKWSNPECLRDSMISGFLGPPSAGGQGLCGFNRGRSLVKSRAKSLAKFSTV